MHDLVFKKLIHSYKDYKITHTGQILSIGYKPDVVLNKGSHYIILECEHGTSRKHFLGGLIKAAEFLTQQRKGMLIYVIKEKSNTTVAQIHNHLAPYFEWIKPLTNLNKVYVISDTDYCSDNNSLIIESSEFVNKSLLIK